MNLKLISQIDRRRLQKDTEIRSELREFNQLSHCEKAEAKHKDQVSKAFRKQVYNELKIELMVKVYRKRVAEVDKKV